MKTVGIVGYGSFGKLAARLLAPHCRVRIYSRSTPVPASFAASLEEVARADVLILSIPLTVYRDFLPVLQPLLASTTVVVDICSVKLKPMQLLAELLPDQPVVATHPLFGPESVSDSVKGFTLVLCPESSDAAAAGNIERFAREQGIEVVQMSAAEHDHEMATVHALTFFIAQSLVEMRLSEPRLSTPSFQKLLQLAELEKHHSKDLFYTIEAGNPLAEEVRERFAAQIDKLSQEIKRVEF